MPLVHLDLIARLGRLGVRAVHQPEGARVPLHGVLRHAANSRLDVAKERDVGVCLPIAGLRKPAKAAGKLWLIQLTKPCLRLSDAGTLHTLTPGDGLQDGFELAFLSLPAA